MMKKMLALAVLIPVIALATNTNQVYVGMMKYFPQGATNTPVSIPMDIGTNNTISEIYEPLPAGSSVKVWNGTGYTSYSKGAKSGSWGAGDSVSIPPTEGHFVSIQSNSALRMVYYGELLEFPYTNSITGTNLVFTGAPLPYIGELEDLGLEDLSAGSSVFLWDVDTEDWVKHTLNANGYWYHNGSISYPETTRPGEGFFIQPKGATEEWTIDPGL